MMADARSHKFDLILTKSLSRFARNTVVALSLVRELTALGITIDFEKESINTLDSKGEVLLTIMASLAQQESPSLSQNVKLTYNTATSRARSRATTTASWAMTRMRMETSSSSPRKPRTSAGSSGNTWKASPSTPLPKLWKPTGS